ncbi:MAG: murein biosynthesis integral membrane protein MurJ [Lachnospiraceae bacterium]|nr:murein biosynthesis integral membrane protein MurJ [Lachnospiraceae bacterium]MCM1237855.1 murein biosynthesis integral membrane protein MurJ [Lachnospiraceae bacterium]
MMNRLLKSSFLLIAGMLLTKILSFARDIVLSYKYGASSISDIYIATSALPTNIIAGIMAAIAIAYVPIYNKIHIQNNGEVNVFTSNCLNVVLAFSVVIYALLMFFTEEFIYVFLGGMNAAFLPMAVGWTKIMGASILFMGISGVFQGYLQAHQSFLIIGICPAVTYIVMIISVLISTEDYLFPLSMGVLLGNVLYFALLWGGSRKYGLRYCGHSKAKKSYLSEFGRLVFPILFSQLLTDVNILIDKRLASGLAPGSITALDYGSKVSSMIYAVIVNPTAGAFFPMLTESLAKKKETLIKDKLIQIFKIVALVVIPITALAFVMARPVIEVLFNRGAFDTEAVNLTAVALQAYLLGVIPIGFRIILEKIYFALSDSHTPMINSAMGIICNIVLNFILIRYFAHIGLALATSIAAWLCVLLYYIRLKRKVDFVSLKPVKGELIKIIIATIIMSIFVYMINVVLMKLQIMQNVVLVRVAVCTIMGVFSYCILLWVLKSSSLIESMKYLKQLVNRGGR